MTKTAAAVAMLVLLGMPLWVDAGAVRSLQQQQQQQSGQQQKEWKKYCIPCQQAAAADAPPGGEQKCWAGWDGKLESELSKLGTAEALVMCCNKNFLLEHLRVPFAMPVGSSAKQFQEAQASLKSQYGCGDASIARVVNDPVIAHSRTYISCADPSQVGILCGASRG